jgi:membrane-bound lytic murein transglycosylase D
MRRTLLALLLACACASPSLAADGAVESPSPSRSGSEIYARFRDGLADPECAPDASSRWRKHFATTPGDMANRDRDTMPLFGYVVDALTDVGLPTEFALIPFVESGYRPGGPAGLWQMIAITARKHGVTVREGYDGRLSPVDSTQAAVAYLRKLYGMFAGDWRLAAMAYNAGENRILGALRRSGQEARSVDIDKLAGVPDVTRAYVRKLHALACVLDEADDGAQWREAIGRQVPLLADVRVPAGVSLESWAARNGLDVVALRRMNPAFAKAANGNGRRLLAPGRPATRAERAFWPEGEISFSVPATPGGARTHVVRRGDSASRIAQRYRVATDDLLLRNGLNASSVLRPGMTLKID